MRTFHDAKAMAKSLRQALAAKNIEISHSDGLELVAAGFGLDNWNVLAAKIAEDGPAPKGAISFGPANPILRRETTLIRLRNSTWTISASPSNGSTGSRTTRRFTVR